MWLPARAPGGRAPGHRDHDPFWARLAEHGVPFVLHVGSGPLPIGAEWMNDGRPPAEQMSGAEIIGSKDFMVVYQPAERFLSVLVLDGVLERHPTLHGGAIEMGAGWVPTMLRRLDHAVAIWSRSEPRLAEFAPPAVRAGRGPAALHAVPVRGRRPAVPRVGSAAVPVLVRLPPRRGRPRPARSLRPLAGRRPAPTSSTASTPATRWSGWERRHDARARRLARPRARGDAPSRAARSATPTTTSGTTRRSATSSRSCTPTPAPATTSSRRFTSTACRATAPTAPRRCAPVGETEFAARAGGASAAAAGACIAAIVGFADLALGDGAEAVLAAHVDAGAGRFRGIRHATSWDPDPAIRNAHIELARRPHGHARRSATGFAVLGAHGPDASTPGCTTRSSPELVDLARAVPDATIVLDHLGGPLGIGPYAGRRDEVLGELAAVDGATWRRARTCT